MCTKQLIENFLDDEPQVLWISEVNSTEAFKPDVDKVKQMYLYVYTPYVKYVKLKNVYVCANIYIYIYIYM